MYCTYMHVKADTKEPFYIGKGTIKKKRHLQKTNRNRYWLNTVAKHGFIPVILSTWENEEDAYEHEKFLISCFKDIGVGLVNLTNGGDGVRGYKFSEEFKLEQSIRLKNEYADPVQRAKRIAAQKKRFSSIEEREKYSILIKSKWTKEMRDAAAERANERFRNGINPRKKISDELIYKMAMEVESGMQVKVVASLHGVSRSRFTVLLAKFRKEHKFS